MRPLYGGTGKLKGFIKILRDLTEEKYAQEQLRLFVENVTDYALIQVNLDGRVSSWNPGAQWITGYTEAEILGRHMSMLCTQEDVDADFIGEELARAV